MDTNQVGSINFDANALYLEEDSEHEDDKQQDNEVCSKIPGFYGLNQVFIAFYFILIASSPDISRRLGWFR